VNSDPLRSGEVNRFSAENVPISVPGPAPRPARLARQASGEWSEGSQIQALERLVDAAVEAAHALRQLATALTGVDEHPTCPPRTDAE
jgi:hypothetical protein